MMRPAKPGNTAVMCMLVCQVRAEVFGLWAKMACLYMNIFHSGGARVCMCVCVLGVFG